MKLISVTSTSAILAGDDVSLLFSYGVPVAVTKWCKDGKRGWRLPQISTTTSRHINQFMGHLTRKVVVKTEEELLRIYRGGFIDDCTTVGQ